MRTPSLKTTLLLLIVISLFGTTAISVPAGALSVSSSVTVLYLGQTEAYVNETKVTLKQPPLTLNGTTYIPWTGLAPLFGLKLSGDARKKMFVATSERAYLEVQMTKKTFFYNGQPAPLGTLLRMHQKSLYVQLRAVSQWFGLTLQHDIKNKKVTLTYVPAPAMKNSANVEVTLPLARFYTSKSTYRPGEKITYFDVSYDPDGQGIVRTQWEGRQDVFFSPGEYSVRLRVTDDHNQTSLPFTRTIRVSGEPLYTPMQYHIMSATPGSTLKWQSAFHEARVKGLPQAARNSFVAPERSLLVSDSPERITEPGILYEDRAAGKVRLYANHKNGMNQPIQFAILVTNESDSAVELTATNQGEVFPSKFANLNGHQATLEFLFNQTTARTLPVGARQTAVFALMPNLFTGQGVNVIYDVETPLNVPLKYTFIAVPASEDFNAWDVTSLQKWAQLPYNGHVRGTFPTAERRIVVAGLQLQKPVRLTIGDNVADPFIEGVDPTRGIAVKNTGNYGVVYQIRLQSPPPMAIMMYARGGIFKGHFKVGEQLILTPRTGVLTPQDGMFLLARTGAGEAELLIEFSPPAASSFPIDLVFFPLNDTIKDI